LSVACRRLAWQLLLVGCCRAGPAFVKWGQWSSTRTDLFPQDFCDALSSLHDQAPQHSLAHTRREVERAFGLPCQQLFASFEPQPIASGSIAQVCWLVGGWRWGRGVGEVGHVSIICWACRQ
jgi:aarF domain-containing kinase